LSQVCAGNAQIDEISKAVSNADTKIMEAAQSGSLMRIAVTSG
jgi:hypothetical protein